VNSTTVCIFTLWSARN